MVVAPPNNDAVQQPQAPIQQQQEPPPSVVTSVPLLVGPRDSAPAAMKTQKDKCQLFDCINPTQCNTVNSKFAVVVEINGQLVIYCGVAHFTSAEFMQVVRTQLNELLAASAPSNSNSTVYTCAVSACAKRCSGVFQIYGKPTAQIPTPHKLYCCSITCVLNRLAIFNASTFRKFVNKK